MDEWFKKLEETAFAIWQSDRIKLGGSFIELPDRDWINMNRDSKKFYVDQAMNKLYLDSLGRLD